jgi:hypothetical protein
MKQYLIIVAAILTAAAIIAFIVEDQRGSARAAAAKRDLELLEAQSKELQQPHTNLRGTIELPYEPDQSMKPKKAKENNNGTAR